MSTKPATDRHCYGILLNHAVFTGLSAGALPNSRFHSGAAATTADHRIIYDPVTGNLYFDSDGTGAAAKILFAVLDNAPGNLSAADFFVV